MASLIGQHQISTFTSPVNGTSPINANEVRGNDNTIKTAYDAHDNDATIHFQDSEAASRPAAGTAGRKWLNSDTLRIYYDTGSVWSEVAYALAASPTFTGQAQFADGTVAAPSITFTGDLNTGIYRIGADDFGVTCNGVNVVEFTQNALKINTGILSFNQATATIIPGATALRIANNANDRSNLTLADVGDLTIYGNITSTVGNLEFEASDPEIVYGNATTLTIKNSGVNSVIFAASGNATFGAAVALNGALSGVTTLAASSNATIGGTLGVTGITDFAASARIGAGGFLVFRDSVPAQVGAIGRAALVLGSGGSDLAYFAESGLGHRWAVNGSATPTMQLTSAGTLAVAGVFSATAEDVQHRFGGAGGVIGTGYTAVTSYGSVGGGFRFGANGAQNGVLFADSSGTNLNSVDNNPLSFSTNGTVRYSISGAGVHAFTGAATMSSTLGVGGALSIGNTVNVVSPTSPNRTITMVIGGDTYYIPAKTTND